MEQKLYLRPAAEDDCKILFEWRNEKDTRCNSFYKNEILWDEHCAWFKTKLEDNDEKIFIFMNDNSSIGQVRLSKNEDCVILSYSIDVAYRGQGYGKICVALAENKVIELYGNIMIIARVKKQNVASQKIFERLNYKKLECKEYYEYKKILKTL